ncbi:MAG: hypothetical protein IKC45_03915 [Clostridia bacterium]|nr:hypothetical protein [Clostridia bacterium]
MKKEQLFDILGEVDEKKIQSAGEVMSRKKKTTSIWLKYGTLVACLCLVIISILSFHLYAKQFVISNNITVYSELLLESDYCEVTEEQAKKLEKANSIHKKLSTQNFEWYGNCYYDFENDKIMLGLTEISDSNKESVLSYTKNTIVEFYQCDYSYKYLEELYNKLDKNRVILYLFGADRFNISIDKNKVNVHLTNDNKYTAIYIANKMDTIGGAITFSSDIQPTDGDG